MDILLRETLGESRGLETHRDTELSGDTFTLGSAPDQQIQLLGADVLPEHALLRSSGSRLAVRCRRGARVNVNGKSTRSAVLDRGDVLEVAGHELTIIDPPAGFDLALALVPNPEVSSSAYEASFRTDLDQTWLSRRGPAWTLLVVVLAVTLGLPLGYVLLVDGEPETRRSGLPPDVLWTSGPLHPVHDLALGNDCGACHSQLFQRVQDEDCRACHDALADHVPDPRASELELAHQRCASCHREHNEPEHLVILADGQCTDCHADHDAFARPLAVAAVSGFSETAHPPFQARLLKPEVSEAGTGFSFSWRYHVESIAGAREESNLVFPHDIHLDEVKVRNPNDSSPLGCADCHALSEDREHFRPIGMEAHCSACHELTFDVTAPDRQLPHGQPREVAFAIEGYFSRKFLNPTADQPEAPRRRRPDRASDSRRCTDAPPVCAERLTTQEVMNQFQVRGCVTCHTVSDNGASDIYSRFQVHPVRLVRDYFESARFDHSSHLTQENRTGDEACLSCHAAKTSGTSQDLLMPDIDNCTQCHGDPSVPDLVTLQCVQCHEFHPSAFGSRNAVLDAVPGGSAR